MHCNGAPSKKCLSAFSLVSGLALDMLACSVRALSGVTCMLMQAGDYGKLPSDLEEWERDMIGTLTHPTQDFRLTAAEVAERALKEFHLLQAAQTAPIIPMQPSPPAAAAVADGQATTRTPPAADRTSPAPSSQVCACLHLGLERWALCHRRVCSGCCKVQLAGTPFRCISAFMNIDQVLCSGWNRMLGRYLIDCLIDAVASSCMLADDLPSVHFTMLGRSAIW